jgi:hypothetical protein
MRKLIPLMIACFLLFAFSGQAEWVACDPAPENADADPDNDVVNVVIMQSGAEIIRAYELTADQQHVKLVDISVIAQASYQFAFENSQGRRSEPVSYTVYYKPAGCSGIVIIKD